ncbi:MAG: hypothetical protein ACPIOQ_70485 [Promethearchaeia archaeon]
MQALRSHETTGSHARYARCCLFDKRYQQLSANIFQRMEGDTMGGGGKPLC